MEEVKQSKYYIGYMDILGYKEFFEKHEGETEDFLTTIEEAFEETVSQIRAYEKSEKDIKVEFTPGIKVFSDNILIALKCKKMNKDNYLPYMRLVKLMANIQLRFITKYSLVIRGSIAKGMFYYNNSLVFGKALITAYEMEQGAVFPKITLEKNEVEEITRYVNSNPDSEPEKSAVIAVAVRTAIAKDGDNSYFIHYLPAYSHDDDFKNISIQNFFSLSCNEPPSSTAPDKENLEDEDKEKQLSDHKKVLLKKINEYGNYNDILKKSNWNQKDVDLRRSVLFKYMWVVDYHNKACEIMNLPRYKINCTILTDPQTHQPVVKAFDD